MKTTLATIAAALALGALAGSSGCVADNTASLEPQAICAPTDDCTFSDTCDAQYIGYPALDKSLNANDVVWLFIQMANRLKDNSDPSTGRVNTNDAHIDETAVEYEGALGGEQLIGSNFHVPADGTAVVSVRLALGAAVDGEVVAHIRFRGYYDDATRFETGDFPVTIRVCGAGGTGGCAPACGATCPPQGEGQRPVACP